MPSTVTAGLGNFFNKKLFEGKEIEADIIVSFLKSSGEGEHLYLS